MIAKRNMTRIVWLLPVAFLAVSAGHALATHPAEARFREIAPWLPKSLPAVGEVVAFEEHADFVYLAGRLSKEEKTEPGHDDHAARIRLILLRPDTLLVDLWPIDPSQHDLGDPVAKLEQKLLPRNDKKRQRVTCLFQSPAARAEPKLEHLVTAYGELGFTVLTGDRRCRVVLPLRFDQPARISVESNDEETILVWRRLPDGVLPLGTKGMRLLESWDSRYRRDSRPPWDKGFPSSHLKAAVESGEVKPGRAVVLGCGTGTNAIYLAQQGFDVTAIDVAPTAVDLAEEKARTARVKVRWLLSDVLAPPAGLEPFDFIFDRGCYHGVRRGNARGYVEAVKRLSRPGTNVLILAGNANEERHYGPPRVKEEELRGDFSSAFDFVRLNTVRFDSTDPNGKGALAWSVLLSRKK